MFWKRVRSSVSLGLVRIDKKSSENIRYPDYTSLPAVQQIQSHNSPYSDQHTNSPPLYSDADERSLNLSMEEEKDNSMKDLIQYEANLSSQSIDSAKDSSKGPNSFLPTESLNDKSPLDLEKLMQENIPQDLTGQVTIPDFRRPIYGGFAAVHKGLWNGKHVRCHKYSCPY